MTEEQRRLRGQEKLLNSEVERMGEAMGQMETALTSIDEQINKQPTALKNDINQYLAQYASLMSQKRVVEANALANAFKLKHDGSNI